MLLRLLCAAVMMLVAGNALAGIEFVGEGQARSLLLEATENSEGNAVPIPGTAWWTRGVDDEGNPTLVGGADIPDGRLHAHVTIRQNVDASLPASHIIEVNFAPDGGFEGGLIAGLPGVLLKNSETVRGEPLVGASVRYTENGFLFALSNHSEDVAGNAKLLSSQKWIDFAVIYGTGRRAIVSMEKDDAAMRLFTDVLTEWGTIPSNVACPTSGQRATERCPPRRR